MKEFDELPRLMTEFVDARELPIEVFDFCFRRSWLLATEEEVDLT